jgi:peptide-methionine (S)-S-oxide reductase
MMRKILLATLLTGALAVASQHHAAAGALPVPAPAVDAPLASAPGTETAILSGGCFWGMQLVFQHVKGVREAISGYTGGAAGTAAYEDVSTGTTGHAESVKIVFDPSVVSYGTLLRVYFSVATDPTQLNQQYPDQGPQYRGEIWVGNATQRRIATAYISQLTTAHAFATRIVTRVDTMMPFYPAETYHQDYATLNPDNPYIATYDAPKLSALAQSFPGLYAARPAPWGRPGAS